MRNNFCVCFRFENVTVVFQFLFELVKVLNDAVVNNGYLTCTIHMWMRINFKRRAMRGPSSMSDTDASRQVIQILNFVYFIDHPTVFLDVNFTVIYGIFSD